MANMTNGSHNDVSNISSMIPHQNEVSAKYLKEKGSTERLYKDESELNSIKFSNNLSNKIINIKKEEEGLLTENNKNEVEPILWPQILASSAGALLHLQIGVVMSFSSIVIPIFTNPNSTQIYMNKDEISLFCSINNVGTLTGAFFSGFLISKVGQRITILLILPIGVFGWLLLAYSMNYNALIVSRIAVGLVHGVIENSVNSYIVEVAHTSVRGRLMAIFDVVRPMAFLYVSILGSTNLHWQTVGLICGLSSLVLPFFILIALPNSPRWLATHGRHEEVKKSLTFYRGASYNVEKEFDDIFVQLKETPNSGQLFEQIKLFKSRKIYKNFSILAILMFCFHLTGNIVTVAYSVSIFQAANTTVNAYLSAIVSSIVRIMGSATNFLISNKFKRKSIILPAMMMAGISMATLGMYFYLMQYYDMNNVSWAPLPIMAVYLFSTTLYLPSFNTIRSELTPTAIRAIGNGFHFLMLSTGMFLVLHAFPYMTDYIGYHWTFWSYVLTIAFMFSTILFCLPETKGKTLEEIADDM